MVIQININGKRKFKKKCTQFPQIIHFELGKARYVSPSLIHKLIEKTKTTFLKRRKWNDYIHNRKQVLSIKFWKNTWKMNYWYLYIIPIINTDTKIRSKKRRKGNKSLVTKLQSTKWFCNVSVQQCRN